MTTTEVTPPIELNGWFGRAWEKVASILAVIGLIDVSSQLIHWAALIHWIAEKYAAVRAWLFGCLPFHIPPEWHDPIVLFLILFSVTNVGLYRNTKRTIAFHLFNRNTGFILIGLCLFSAIWFATAKLFFTSIFSNIGLFAVFCAGAVTSRILALTWRWLLTTATIFGALVAINEAYVLWLAALAEH